MYYNIKVKNKLFTTNTYFIVIKITLLITNSNILYR